MQAVLGRLNQVFQEVFADDDLLVTPATTARDVEDWDSLMHVSLMVNVERAFNIKFSSAEIAGMKNVGELIQLIESRAKL